MRANGLADVCTKPRGGLARGGTGMGGNGGVGVGGEERVSREGHEPCSTARGSQPASHRAALDTDEEEEKRA